MDKRTDQLPDRLRKMERISQYISDRHDNFHAHHLQNRNTILINSNLMAYLSNHSCFKKGEKVIWSIAHSLLSLPGENH